ncbi:hypothetical protein CLAFUW4_04022 [Fulvia fulva]|uniref:Uncharacterized protein n=1 Tax=Passalora fulva TaxID=5499 RepID=A0A9Q8LE42_PASFU|nr:uncharacterized protein CLAFUR5_03987 [Fulvia fulva]KAK4627026.1 hypothetical protein CLAFUR4_04008 [Fulvia fulva]KAK4627493.1 hypothetical protein CLAFUR0_04009 [Fulvia fulva]UJO15709.1 hypothetical protein CLAFUR5_03987 [Fulvia fulva]WPV13371.1 hypothetical protein CLAFUW4_04022 [Fulvia fulva]WPV29326.1 hypothetical protein CLAFUW7_04011 [Fulvia fulva]
MKTTLFSLLMSATLTVAAPVSQVDDERVGTYLPGICHTAGVDEQTCLYSVIGGGPNAACSIDGGQCTYYLDPHGQRYANCV